MDLDSVPAYEFGLVIHLELLTPLLSCLLSKEDTLLCPSIFSPPVSSLRVTADCNKTDARCTFGCEHLPGCTFGCEHLPAAQPCRSLPPIQLSSGYS